MRIRLIIISIFILGITSICIAQPPPPPGGPGCWPPPCVPIDGGISLLIAAGAIYGGRKLYYNKKNKQSL
jgi:hypothetical protein